MSSDDRHDATASDASSETGALVRRVIAGDTDAFGLLYRIWFDRVFDAARRVVGDDAAAADVAQDTFLRAWRSITTVRDPDVFGGWLLRITRNAALTHLGREARARAVDREGMEMIERGGAASPSAPTGFGIEDRMARADDPATAAEDGELVALVEESVATLDGRDAEVLHLGLRYGMSPAEIGEAIGLSRNAANQAAFRARRRLRTAVEARVLWHRGAPRCDALAAAIVDGGIARFDAEAVSVIDAHALSCAECQERRRLRLEPAALFGAVPLVMAPVLLKSKVAAALAGEGVPMQGFPPTNAPPPGAPSGPPAAATAGGDVEPVTSGDGHPGEAALVARRATLGRTRRRAALVALLALLLGVLGFALATGSEDATTVRSTAEPEEQLASPPSTTPPTAAVEAPPTTLALVAPSAVPTAPPATTPPPLPPPPPPPPAVTGSLTLNPSTVPGSTWVLAGNPNAPRLTWATDQASSVTVSGPGSMSSSPSGSVLICPGMSTGSLCITGPGTYAYTLTARDAAGNIALTRQVQLVVT